MPLLDKDRMNVLIVLHNFLICVGEDTEKFRLMNIIMFYVYYLWFSTLFWSGKNHNRECQVHK